MQESHSFDEQAVLDAYAVVRRCCTAYITYKALATEVLLKHQKESGSSDFVPKGEILNRLSECVEEFRVATDLAEPLVDALVWHAPALSPEPVEFGFIKASSWAEGTVRLLKKLAERSLDWTAFGEQTEKNQRYMVNVLQNTHMDPYLLESNVKIEAARLRDRAVALSAHGRYGYILTKLSPQSARFLELLIDHESRMVPFDRVEEHLWSEDFSQRKNLKGRRNAALHKLRTELVEQGYKDMKARIVTHQETGYSLSQR